MLADMPAERRTAATSPAAATSLAGLEMLTVSRRRAVNDGIAILVIWIVTWFNAVFVEPNYDEFSTAELTYSTVCNAVVGAIVGFYLFDRVTSTGLSGFAARASAVIVGVTLFNEILIEPFAFGQGPINGEGVYHGVLDSLIAALLFMLLRLVGRVASLQRHARAALDAIRAAPSRAATACFLVRVAGETRRIYVKDVLYLQAERDFTRIVCDDGEHFASENLKSLIEKAQGLDILRVHKSYAVNVERVDRITRMEACIGDIVVPIGRRHWQEFSERWAAQALQHDRIAGR